MKTANRAIKAIISFVQNYDEKIQATLAVLTVITRILLLTATILTLSLVTFLGLAIFSMLREDLVKTPTTKKEVPLLAEPVDLTDFPPIADPWLEIDAIKAHAPLKKQPENRQSQKIIYLLPPAKNEQQTKFKPLEQRTKSKKQAKKQTSKQMVLARFGTTKSVKDVYPNLNLRRNDSWELILQDLTAQLNQDQMATSA